MDKADQHDACDQVRKWRRNCQQKPCGFAAALGRRYRVAHNSTGPTSVSTDLEIRKGAGARPDDQLRQREHALVRQPSTSRQHSPVRQYASHPVCRAAKALAVGAFGHPSVMQFYSGPLMHFLSGVDTPQSSFTQWGESALIYQMAQNRKSRPIVELQGGMPLARAYGLIFACGRFR